MKSSSPPLSAQDLNRGSPGVQAILELISDTRAELAAYHRQHQALSDDVRQELALYREQSTAGILELQMEVLEGRDEAAVAHQRILEAVRQRTDWPSPMTALWAAAPVSPPAVDQQLLPGSGDPILPVAADPRLSFIPSGDSQQTTVDFSSFLMPGYGTDVSPQREEHDTDAMSCSDLNSGIESLPDNISIATSASSAGPSRRSKPRPAQAVAERSLRQRTGTPDYVGHPIDRYERGLRNSTSNVSRSPLAAPPMIPVAPEGASVYESARETTTPPLRAGSAALSASGSQTKSTNRSVRGISELSAESCLPPSEGPKSNPNPTGVKWPVYGPYTQNGIISEVSCDDCRGRVHWACAGLGPKDMVENEPWSCPACAARMDRDGTPTAEDVTAAQTDRCLRPDCIRRSNVKFKANKDDPHKFVMDAIIGHRRIKFLGNRQPVYEYLVRWVKYPVYDCTWQDKKDIPSCEHYYAKFVQQCKEWDVDPKRRVTLLPQAQEWFDDRGNLMKQKLKTVGIKPATWHD